MRSKLSAALVLSTSAFVAHADAFNFVFQATDPTIPSVTFSLPGDVGQYVQEPHLLGVPATLDSPVVPIQLGSSTIESVISFPQGSGDFLSFNSKDDGIGVATSVLTTGPAGLTFAPSIYAASLFNEYPMDGIPFVDPSHAIAGTLTITETPEPSSIALIGTGVLGIVCIARRRTHSY